MQTIVLRVSVITPFTSNSIYRKGSVNVNFTINYFAAPFNEILIIQNAIDKVGYIDNIPVQYINVSSGSGKFLLCLTNPRDCIKIICSIF